MYSIVSVGNGGQVPTLPTLATILPMFLPIYFGRIFR